ncbi:unnamed protein product [Vitrella brassicaformis CCMP3155]|uniref:Piwi domain-containing protein n=2 Tax=Vitrella brassicaformis TaxID=1169539 RepID=A0A0G4EMK2_VITBC|nr:unnamed protein product [Vitrella brassicaformis CCMP3155]|eukprot:CEL98711.1 unnamed protein product [Vitrella brassicaformis CCMP3155]
MSFQQPSSSAVAAADPAGAVPPPPESVAGFPASAPGAPQQPAHVSNRQNFAKVRLKSNCFELQQCHGAEWVLYDVKAEDLDAYNEKEVSFQMRTAVARSAKKVEQALKSQYIVPTGRQLIAAAIPGQQLEVTATLKLKPAMRSDEMDVEYEFTFTRVKKLDVADFGVMRSQEGRMYLDNLFKALARKSKRCGVRGVYFDFAAPVCTLKPERSTPDQHSIRVCRGMILTTIATMRGPVLQLDVKHICIKEAPVYEILQAAMRSSSKAANLAVLGELYEGRGVVTYHADQWYRIDGLVEKDLKKDGFMNNRTNDFVTFFDYFSQHYSRLRGVSADKYLSPSRQPFVKSIRNGKEIFIPTTLCYLTGLDDETKSNRQKMQLVHNYCRLPPDRRFRMYEDLLGALDKVEREKKILRQFHLQMMPSAVEVEASQISSSLFSGYSTENLEDDEQQTVKFNRALFVCKGRHTDLRRRLVDSLMTKGKRFGLLDEHTDQTGRPFNPVYTVDLASHERGVTDTDLRQAAERVREFNGGITCIVWILDDSGGRSKDAVGEDRAKIKQAFSLHSTQDSIVCASQCLKASTVQKKWGVAEAKVIDKIRNKMSGYSYHVKVADRHPDFGPDGVEGRKKTMVCGIDTIRRKVHGKWQICMVFTASFNEKYTRYLSRVDFFESAQATAVDWTKVKESFTAACKKYFITHSELPDQILIYRSGVSEGQKVTCVRFELPGVFEGINEALAKANEALTARKNKFAGLISQGKDEEAALTTAKLTPHTKDLNEFPRPTVAFIFVNKHVTMRFTTHVSEPRDVRPRGGDVPPATSTQTTPSLPSTYPSSHASPARPTDRGGRYGGGYGRGNGGNGGGYGGNGGKRSHDAYRRGDGSVQPGTVVDSGVTSRDVWDFYFYHGRAPPGSCPTPTLYHVLYNNTGVSVPNLYIYTHLLTMSYQNFHKRDEGIKVPAPVKMAEKLLQYISGALKWDKPHKHLNCTNFYL